MPIAPLQGFLIALADANGNRLPNSGIQLAPAPVHLDYPIEFMGSIQETADGGAVQQEPNGDPRRRVWQWENYPSWHPAYQKLWAFLLTLRSRSRFASGQSPYVYIGDTVSGQLQRQFQIAHAIASATAATVVLADAVPDGRYTGARLEVIAGAGAGQSRAVLSQAGATCAVDRAWETVLDASSHVLITYQAPDWFRCRVIDVAREVADGKTNVVYAKTRLVFVLDDPPGFVPTEPGGSSGGQTPSSVTVSVPSQTATVNATLPVTAHVRDQTGTVIPGLVPTLSVSNPAVAGLSGTTLTCYSVGTVTVTATYGPFTSTTAPITVASNVSRGTRTVTVSGTTIAAAASRTRSVLASVVGRKSLTRSTTVAAVLMQRRTVTTILSAVGRKSLSLTATVSGVAGASSSGVYTNGYTYRKAVTVDHTKVSGGADLSNFPILVSVTDAALKTAANGGHVQSASGYDIRFETAAGVKLDFEIDQWSASSGLLLAWVRLPTLSASADTVVYLYYGNATVAATEANPAGVWDAAYVGVYHFGTASALSGADATGGGALSFGTATAATAGYFGGGALENGTIDSDNTIANRAALQFTHFSLTCWTKLNATQPNPWSKIFTKGHDASWSLQATRGGVAAVDLRLFSSAGTEAAHAQGPSVNDGTWHYVAASYDGAQLRVIVDNQAPVTTAYSGPVAVDTTDPVAVAGENGNNSASIVGSLDEVRFANAARSQGWFNTEYANQSSPSTFFTVGLEQQAP